MKIIKFEIFVCEIPFRIEIEHALAAHNSVLSLFVKVYCDNGVFGWGETIPRYYVTRETIASEFSGIRQASVLFVGRKFSTSAALVKALKEITPFGAGQAGLELALLDAGSKYFQESIPNILGRKVIRDKIEYSGAVLSRSLYGAVKFALLMKRWGFKKIKVKVGMNNDFIIMLVSRLILGKNVNLRIDANGAWKPAEAIAKVKKLKKWFKIEAVEQPTGSVKDQDHINKLCLVTKAVDVPVIADESLSTIESAELLAAGKCCNVFNIRVSKHGGLLNSLQIADIAAKNGLGIQLGSHIGESGILAAAGQLFASMTNNILFAEGGGSDKFLFPESFIKEDLSPKSGGVTPLVSGNGLGITVNEKIVEKYLLQKEVVDLSTVREYEQVCKLLPTLFK